MKEKFLIIGGSGFIGTRLVRRLLAAGYDVRIFDIEISSTYPDLWIRGDVRDLDALTRACEGMQVIYNLAAEHRDDVRPKSLYTDVNVKGAMNICAAAKAADIDRIIFTSSVAIYKWKNSEISERDKIEPFNEYGNSKLEAEQVFNEWQGKSDNKTLVIVRPVVVFGEGNRGNVYNLMKAVAHGQFIMVGNGKNKKSMAYVENVAAFLEFTLTLGVGTRIYNYADKPDMDMNHLVERINAVLGMHKMQKLRLPYALAYSVGLFADFMSLFRRSSFPISAIRIMKFCANTQFSAKEAYSMGFSPAVSLDDALTITLQEEFPDILCR